MSNINCSEKSNILAIGAHPDDVEFGCGGALRKHIENGDEVYVLILTNGEKGNHSLDKKECMASMGELGIKEENIIFGGFPDGFVKHDFETVNFIEGWINKLGINRVYTHDAHDRHQDHVNCSLAVSSAARKIPELLLFQGPSTKDPFEPHYFIEVLDEHLEKKINALKSYKTQIAKGILDLRMAEGFAIIHGRKGESEYAEAFALNHFFAKGKNI